jgi:molybdenum cofactor cytidylyltransferase
LPGAVVIAGLLLAAGGSSRFGSQKLVAMLDGVPLVRHAAMSLARSTDALVIVLGHEADAVRAALSDVDAAVVENPDWSQGLSSSVKCGVAALSPGVDAIVVALGDQPRLDPLVVRSLIDRWRASGKPIVSARYRGERGHPVLFDRAVFSQLEILRGDVGARTMFERSPELVAYVDVDNAVPVDVDTPTDLGAVDTGRSP